MSKQVNLEKPVRRGEQDATAQGQGEQGIPSAPSTDDAAVPNGHAVLRRARRARRRSSAGFGTKWHLASVLAAALCATFQPVAMRSAQAAPPRPVTATAASSAKPAATPPAAALAPLAPCSSTGMAEPATITLGKSTLVRLPSPVVRLVVGGFGPGYAGKPFEQEVKPPPSQAAQQMRTPQTTQKTGVADVDVMLLSPTELYLLGKRVGSMNVIVQDRSDRCTVMDIIVTVDSDSLQAKLSQLMPDERSIKVAAADDSLILSGDVSDAMKLDRAMMLAAAYAPEKRVVNLMRTRAASQVMLEVKVAEVSKTLLDQLGARFNSQSNGGGPGRWTYSLLSEFLTSGTGFVQALKLGKTTAIINGEKDDGIVRVLAEPNIMAVSGQQASFLSGGKIFIPVARDNGAGGTTITLEEKEFGVGVRFTPTVLDGDRINLKVASEVSELSQTGSPFTTVGGVTAVLPSFTTRKADTTVQLRDGQSFAIAGLIKNNMSESVKRFPGLGEIPLLGALFRSSEFQRDMTELLFIITPRLVKPLPQGYALPTDNLKEPTRGEFLFGGTLEGSGQTPGKAPPKPVAAAAPEGRETDAAKALPAPPAVAPAEAPRPPAEPQLSTRVSSADVVAEAQTIPVAPPALPTPLEAGAADAAASAAPAPRTEEAGHAGAHDALRAESTDASAAPAPVENADVVKVDGGKAEAADAGGGEKQ